MLVCGVFRLHYPLPLQHERLLLIAQLLVLLYLLTNCAESFPLLAS